MEKPKLIIFDFDGTLADSFGVLLDVYNRIAPEYGCLPIEESEIELLRETDPKVVLAQHGVTIFKLPRLIKRIHQEMKLEVSTFSLHSEIKEMIIKFHDSGYSLGILTTNSEENARAVLRREGIEGKFEFVESYKKVFGKHKALRKFVRSYGLRASEVVYVGDETRDVHAAKKAKVISIAVTWGFAARSLLQRNNPDLLVDSPEDLVKSMVFPGG